MRRNERAISVYCERCAIPRKSQMVPCAIANCLSCCQVVVFSNIVNILIRADDPDTRPSVGCPGFAPMKRVPTTLSARLRRRAFNPRHCSPSSVAGGEIRRWTLQTSPGRKGDGTVGDARTVRRPRNFGRRSLHARIVGRRVGLQAGKVVQAARDARIADAPEAEEHERDEGPTSHFVQSRRAPELNAPADRRRFARCA